jgi:hypothetical protein
MSYKTRKAQLFSEDIIFAMVLVLFIFSIWLVLRDRVLHLISTSEDKRELDEAASDALSQLLETSGKPTNWNSLSSINETTVESIGLVSDKNTLDSEKVEKFVRLARGKNSSASLAALWHFDEGSDTVVYDSSGNGNTGSFYNTPDWVGGKFGSGLQFLSSDTEHIIVSDSNSLDMGGSLTIELWFKKPLSGVSTPGYWLVNKGDTHNHNDSNYEVWLHNDEKIRAGIGSGTGEQNVTSMSTVQPNVWYHVAFTADGTNLTLYVNGVRENSTSQILNPLPNNGDLTISSRTTADVLFRFNGTIDEVAIYSRAKSAEEIAADAADKIASASDYTSIKKLLGLDRSGYNFNFTISSLTGTTLHSVYYIPSTIGNASYAAVNTTAFIERFALLNNSLVKVTLGVWIE